MNSYVVKICGLLSDGSFTKTKSHSYFVGKRVYERFDSLVFSLSTDPKNLYDDEYGILTEGKIRREYIDEYGEDSLDIWHAPANYHMRGRQWERPVFVEIIDREGQLILEQNAGMRIFGFSSRAHNQKSFRLIARCIYEPGTKGIFSYDFFPEDQTYSGLPLTGYKQIILRNNGSDMGMTFLNDVTVGELASTILPDTKAAKAAAVFLNGEYYGFVWVNQAYKDDYFRSKNEMANYDAEDEGFVILGEGVLEKIPDKDFEYAADEYQAIFELYKKGFEDDTVFDEFCAAVDLENLLAYYAVQIYINNIEWPGMNYRVYRYYGESGYLDSFNTRDGKWRWLLFDADCALGWYAGEVTDPSLAWALGIVPHGAYSQLLRHLLERDDVRARFITVMCDIMNYHFSSERLEAVARRRESERINELLHNYALGGAMGLDNHWSNVEYVAAQVDNLVAFGFERPAVMREHIEKYMDIAPSGFQVHVRAHNLADIRLNTIDISEDFNGWYYDICELELSASSPPGYEFSHWLINGEERYDEELTVGSEDADIYAYAGIELFLKESENAVPVVTRIDYEKKTDCIEIHNPFATDIDLGRYFVSDDTVNPYKQLLAGRILRPGESVVIYCDNCRSEETLGSFSLGFNLKNGETLLITDMRGERVFEYTLPDMDNDYVLAMDMRSGKYIARLR